MAGLLSISSALSHDPETAYLKILFAQGFNIQTADHDLLNKFVIHRFNQYAALDAEDYGLWDLIQMDFEKFEAKHFDELDSTTWRVVRGYCYPHGYWIDHNFGPGRTRTTVMLKAVEAEWNDEWTLEQIKWVEKHYDTLSRITRKRKQELTGITNFESAGNLESTTANPQGLSQNHGHNHFRTSDFRPYHSSLQWNRCILLYQSHLRMHIILINLNCPQNKTLTATVFTANTPASRPIIVSTAAFCATRRA